MASISLQMILLLFLEAILVGGFGQKLHQVTRNDFPPKFIFGAGASAYQVEGAVAEDGRTPCVWDTFTHARKMADKSTADVSADQYHKYKGDVKLMYDMGLPAYRFSISWSRLLPAGRGAVNPKGLEYYNNLINELLEYGIEPHVTLHHLDLPQVLEDEYGGWLNKKIVKDFAAYADICFREFGDRVIYWSTLNEPNVLAFGAYDAGIIPPQRCSSPYGYTNCTAGNSSIEPYIVTHNQLIAHAAVARLYYTKYKAKQNGWIGITILAFFFVPHTNRTEDVAASQRAFDFMMGWYLRPLVLGDYPEVMKKNAGARLPIFSKGQSALVKGSFDFIGVNHYEAVSVSDNSQSSKKYLIRDFFGDMMARFVADGEGSAAGPLDLVFPVTPWGLEGVLEYIKTNYGNPPVFVHENGYGIPYTAELNDTGRINYLNVYLEYLLRAIRNGSNTKGYFVWSFVDVFEVRFGYRASYGLYKVDFNDKNLTRHARSSAQWYSNFLKNNLNIEELDIFSVSQAIK